MDSEDYRELNGIDGEPVEFEYFSEDTQRWICSTEIRRHKDGIKPEAFNDRQ